MSSSPQTRKRVLGIGSPRFAHTEFEDLKQIADVFWFTPETHPQVVDGVARLVKEHGPMDAAYVLFGTANYGPFMQDVLGPLFPGCGLFASGGAGYDDVPTEWLAEHGAYAANTPTAVTSATADLTLFLTLSVLRNTSFAESVLRQGVWRDGLELAEDPDGKTFGIFGMGAIGKSVARKVGMLGMRVVYFNRRRLGEEVEKELNATYVSEDDLLAQSDVLSLHCPLTQETTGWLNAERIAKMKDGSFLVNTSRGAVVDEQALISALESRKIRRAGLDVFVNEPKPNEWFTKSPLVTVLPHWGAFTTGTIHRGEREVLDNVKQFVLTGKPRYPVNNPVKKSSASSS
ncbi:uncharacterized protein STEHIDRAFT_76378 [Stereum hirsutum FP-91666 SS1]|uniref:uncharacterized protein n=1 Tax=Stereum hirsutum (strain FP-91666) TaxID=721885 RepID=UPI000440E4F4|nr:uncharacterized protein STEHIDRAFT_76378 [Stereum hirsutum FP-91666 SS1]EIM87767.1 hypothetical protein STEHIDRAFT_76378 [Stereum hirsutum FP-91666 SS1]